MNLVFQALVLFAFVLPGLVFNTAYKKGVWNYPLGRLGPVSEQIPGSIIHAVWLNTTCAIIVYFLHGCFPGLFWRIDYDSVVFWMANSFGKDQAEFGHAVRSITSSPTRIFLYFLGLYGISWGLGQLLHSTLRRLRWDRRFRFLRFENDWHYQLSGEVLDFPDTQFSRASKEDRIRYDDLRGTIITAVVDFKDKSCLYLGVLVDFFYDQAGNLDRLLLEGVLRRDFTKDAVIEEAVSPYHYYPRNWFKIKGRYFVLRMSEIRTINIDYIMEIDLEKVKQMAQLEEQTSREDLIRQRAYEIWLERGRPDAQSSEIWYEAERLITQSLN